MLGFAVLALGLLAGCASPLSFATRGNQDVDISRWRTWSWSPTAPSATDRSIGSALLDAHVRRGVAIGLAQHGVRLVPPAQADAWVDYALQIQRIAKPDGDGGFDVEPAAALLVEMRDSRTDRVGWVGIASGMPRDEAQLEDRQATAEIVAVRLMEQYPKR